MHNFTKNDLFSRMAIFEELSIDFFGEDPENSQILKILSMLGKYGITFSERNP